MCKLAIYKLKILGGRRGFEYYKSIEGTTKRGEPICKVQWGEQKGAITILDLNLVGGKPWRKLCHPSKVDQTITKNTWELHGKK